jgi:hypothetical protein
MDAASNTGLEPMRSRRSRRLERFAIAWLAAVLAVGLWQAYGTWLFSAGADHAF